MIWLMEFEDEHKPKGEKRLVAGMQLKQDEDGPRIKRMGKEEGKERGEMIADWGR